MGYLYHDTRTITVLTDFRSAMPHILQHTERIVHQFMTLVAVDVHYHANTTSIVLIRTLVKSFFLVLKFTICHIILDLTIFLGAKLHLFLSI